MTKAQRCAWCGTDPLYLDYHDFEWGVPVQDDLKLFEMLILEGAQAGLNWLTILRKRANFSKAFDGFNPEKMARYTDKDRQRLLADPGIIRNRLKIDAAIANAKAYLALREQHSSFHSFLWQFVDYQPLQNAWKSIQEIPPSTSHSEAMAKALKKHGFRFVGPTTCYAFMQAVGMANDHTTNCFRHQEIQRLKLDEIS